MRWNRAGIDPATRQIYMKRLSLYNLIIIIIIINSYTLVTSVRPTHGGNLCYVCRVDKTLWGRKPLAIYAAATRSRNGKAETMYQICSR